MWCPNLQTCPPMPESNEVCGPHLVINVNTHTHAHTHRPTHGWCVAVGGVGATVAPSPLAASTRPTFPGQRCAGELRAWQLRSKLRAATQPSLDIKLLDLWPHCCTTTVTSLITSWRVLHPSRAPARTCLHYAWKGAVCLFRPLFSTCLRAVTMNTFSSHRVSFSSHTWFIRLLAPVVHRILSGGSNIDERWRRRVCCRSVHAAPPPPPPDPSVSLQRWC